MPEGYSLEIAGENKLIQDSLRDLILMIAYRYCLYLFNNGGGIPISTITFIVMFTIPLAFTGEFWL